MKASQYLVVYLACIVCAVLAVRANEEAPGRHLLQVHLEGTIYC